MAATLPQARKALHPQGRIVADSVVVLRRAASSSKWRAAGRKERRVKGGNVSAIDRSTQECLHCCLLASPECEGEGEEEAARGVRRRGRGEWVWEKSRWVCLETAGERERRAAATGQLRPRRPGRRRPCPVVPRPAGRRAPPPRPRLRRSGLLSRVWWLRSPSPM